MNRNTKSSIAETDYSYLFKNEIVPIEVKSGKTGSLKSLHQFMRSSPSKQAIRFYSGCLSKEDICFEGRNFSLLSIPFYLQYRLEDMLLV